MKEFKEDFQPYAVANFLMACVTINMKTY